MNREDAKFQFVSCIYAVDTEWMSGFINQINPGNSHGCQLCWQLVCYAVIFFQNAENSMNDIKLV